MKRSIIIVVVALAVTVAALGQMTVKKSQTREEQALLDAERALAAAFTRGDASAFESMLAGEFSFDNQGIVTSAAEFVEYVRNAPGAHRDIRLDEQAARIEGDAAHTSGRIVLSERVMDAAGPLQVKAEPIRAASRVVVNMSEMAKEEAAKPLAVEPERHVAVHPPMSIPDGEPAQAATASNIDRHYRYDAVYVKKSGLLKLVSLRLAHDARP